MQIVTFICLLVLLAFFYFALRKKKPLPVTTTDDTIRKVLEEHVRFYQQLNEAEQSDFVERCIQFLEQVRITAIKSELEDKDRIFVAAAAIIPVFAFKNWRYTNIREVLIYPGSFDHEFNQAGSGRDILGMVGEGAMQNAMVLSQHELRNGFMNPADRSNTAIHEFVHLIDKSDGSTDGIPEALLQHRYAIPWLREVHKEIKRIDDGKSDINPYGATNEAEFFAVASEYFFERPERMKEKHPVLFEMLEKAFHTNPHNEAESSTLNA
ncbi:MAG: peptidase [Pedobacter sp.]|nr:MAG: peptidase [Pedobacter sp.]